MVSSSWTLGLIAALVTWNVTFNPPVPGLDPSWEAGLYIAAHRGMHFGTQIVFTYGPLGFLGLPWMWYSGLSAIAFLYQATLHVALCISLVWALRRTLHPVLALIVTFILVVTAASADVPVVLAAVWCLAALSRDAPPLARQLVLFGGAILGATETLIELRPGPVVLIMCAITLLAQRSWRRDVSLFVGITIVTFAALWFAAGQGLGNLPAFVSNSLQVVSGYSEAMGVQASSHLYLIAELLLAAVLVAAGAVSSAVGRTRLATTIVIGVAAFVLFKEAAVRADTEHPPIFFGTAAGIVAALAYRWRWPVALTGLAAISVVNIAVDHRAGVKVGYDPIAYISRASDQVRLLFNTSRRDVDAHFFFPIGMQEHYALSPETVKLLEGHTVDIDPWEVGVAWAYGLDWDPLPVLQDYSAYTSKLDRLDADELRSRAGPQRILRENPALVDTQYRTPTIDGRFGSWDPPEKSLAMLCNYVPLQTTSRWQVLGKVPDRCGAPRLIGSVDIRAGATVTIPSPPHDGVVYAKIYGAGVSGLERIRTFLYRAKFRYVIVNAGQAYRLVPGTATDGLLMNAGQGADFPAPFALSPSARTVSVTGVSGGLRIDLYSMAIRPR